MILEDESQIEARLKLTDWALGPVGMSKRLAFFENTLSVLERIADQQKNKPFIFSMHKPRSNDEAGFFLPVGRGVFYPAYLEFFDQIDKYKAYYNDDRIIVAACYEVLERAKQIFFQSTSEDEWIKKCNKVSSLFSDVDYVLRDADRESDVIAQEFNFLSGVENRRNVHDKPDTTHGMILTRMRDIFTNLTWRQKYDEPSEERHALLRQAHASWVQGFERSNIYIVAEAGKISKRDGSGYPFNPQTIIA